MEVGKGDEEDDEGGGAEDLGEGEGCGFGTGWCYGGRESGGE